MKNLDGIIERAERDTEKLYSMHLGTSNVLFQFILKLTSVIKVNRKLILLQFLLFLVQKFFFS